MYLMYNFVENGNAVRLGITIEFDLGCETDAGVVMRVHQDSNVKFGS